MELYFFTFLIVKPFPQILILISPTSLPSFWKDTFTKGLLSISMATKIIMTYCFSFFKKFNFIVLIFGCNFFQTCTNLANMQMSLNYSFLAFPSTDHVWWLTTVEDFLETLWKKEKLLINKKFLTFPTKLCTLSKKEISSHSCNFLDKKYKVQMMYVL